MNIVVFNKKGGVGKSTLAVNIARRIDAEFVTNDIGNYTGDAFGIETVEITCLEDLNGLETEKEHLVFDFGGKIDPMVGRVAEIANVCIVPFKYRGNSDFNSSLRSYEYLKEHNNNVVVVINDTRKSNVELLRDSLLEYSEIHSDDLIVMPHSAYFEAHGKDMIGFYERGSGLVKHQLERQVMPAFLKLFKRLGINE